MQLTTLKQRVLDYIHHLSTYDYIAYGWFLGVMLGFLLLAVILAGKKPKTSTFFLFIVLLSIMIGPFGLKYGLDKTIRNAEIVDENITELPFSQNLVVLGAIQNSGKIDYQKCRVFVNVLRDDPNEYKQILYTFKPIRKKTIVIDQNINKGEQMKYKVVLGNFKSPYKYYVSQSVECY